MSNRSTDAVEQRSCPRCLKGGGQPFRLARDAESVRVLLRCGMCHHRWSTIVDADDDLVTSNAQLWVKK